MKGNIAPTAVVLLLSVYYFCGSAMFFSLIIAAIAHELGHIAAICFFGGKLNALRLDALGFSISSSGISSVRGEIIILLAGPMCGIALSLLILTDYEFMILTGFVSLLLSAYNLLPALPLDGGRALACLLESAQGSEFTTKIMDILGMSIGCVLAFSGAVYSKSALLIAGIWILIAQTGIVKNMRVL